ncbi:5679_t:CDS:2 [Paraglomus occultum]|uniref:5679_t:CDS:1 n=1 Tax=Paraglomus occultum TaxID=144539 RepID=A0A9N9DP76_9GLOM|nr:5679_t:CDS:2 [Paraglomus occultum]
MTRKVVVALDPSSDEASYTIEWIIENFLKPEIDDVRLISAVSLNSDFDADELGLYTMSLTEEIMQLEKEIIEKTREAMNDFLEILQAANVIKATIAFFRVLLIQASFYYFQQINARVEVLKSLSDSRNIVVEYIENEKADILIMGSRDLSTWKRLFLGSFSDFCQQNSHCPVLIVKKRQK